MSVYNEQKLIGSALTNLLEMLRKSKVTYEILIGVDGTDGTEKIAREFASKNKHITVFKFKERLGRTKTMNFLIEKAKGEILVNHDADRFLSVDPREIEKMFKDKRVGAIVSTDVGNRDTINEGQRIFEDAYNDIKLNKYLVGNEVPTPLFFSYIFRKSALGKKPYFITTQDDFEVTDKLLKRGYKILYSKKVAKHLADNPNMDRLTPRMIMMRRSRAEMFRGQAPKVLGMTVFRFSARIGEFLQAIALAASRETPREFAEMIYYLFVVFVAVIMARARLLLSKPESNKLGGWKYSTRAQDKVAVVK